MTPKDGHQHHMQTLADLRRAAGLSQTDVADRMGVQQPRVSQIEATYPNVKHASVIAYIEAIGGQVQFTGIGEMALDAPVGVDPERGLTRESMGRSSSKGASLLKERYSASVEELPLEQGTPQTGGDDTGRDVDQGDPEGHQGDRQDREEP